MDTTSIDRTRETAPSRAAKNGLMQNRHLLWQFIQRNIHIRTKGSYLGVFWLALNPLLMMALYTLIFGVIIGSRFEVVPNETNLDFALGVFLGISIFNIVSEIFGTAAFTVVQNPNLVKRVVFPLEILPVASVGAAFYHFLITLGLSLFAIAILGPGLTWSVLFLPFIVLPLFMIVLGVAWFLSAVGVYFRDIQHVTSFVSLALFYSSGIFFSAQSVQERAPEAWQFLRWNPFLHAIELARDVSLWHLPINWPALIYLYLVGIGSIGCGLIVFRKLRPNFADVI